MTEPYLPPLAEFLPYLERIWESKWLTNNGPFHQEFEVALREYLGVEHLSLVTNGTIGLVTALQTLCITGEVITTPYSFVATTHSLIWNRITPVFVDIDPVTMNIDPAKIEAAITPRTTAILPVHCYGRPCDVNAIQAVATRHGLKVIYDAAHAFGVGYRGKSLALHGDLSVLSFHATKVFNTFEGGAIVCPDAQTKQRIDYLKNFGFADEVTVMAPGINGKMSEFQAALGLLQLKHVGIAIEKRRQVDERYREVLAGIRGIAFAAHVADVASNYAHFPIMVGTDYPLTRDELYATLKREGIHARRYFYPLISDMPMYQGLDSASPANLPVARSVAQGILCLPLFPGLTHADQDRIASVIRKTR